jgi:chromosome segregation ATPase
MRRDVNFIFFGLLILLLISMIGIMLYSDYIYHKSNAEYLEFKRKYEKACEDLNESREEMNTKDEDLQRTEQALIDIINELNLSKQRVSSLSDYYTTVKGEKELLEGDLSKTEQERDKWKSDYVTAKQDLGVCEKTLDLEKIQVELLNSEIVTYMNSVDELSADIGNATAQLEVIMEALGYINCNESSCREDKATVEDLINSLQEILIQIDAEIDAMKS